MNEISPLMFFWFSDDQYRAVKMARLECYNHLPQLFNKTIVRYAFDVSKREIFQVEFLENNLKISLSRLTEMF